MAVPTYDEFVEPLLRYLAEHPQGVSAAEAYEALASRLKLTEEDRRLMLPSEAQAVYKNRIGWAHDRLKRAELSSAPKRGFWKLTDKGVTFAAKHPMLSDEDIRRLWNVERGSRLKPPEHGVVSDDVAVGELAEAAEKASPVERIEAALGELRESVARDLLENIGGGSPAFFEQLVLELLHSMGYGTSRSDLQRVGGSGDGGIDGIISLDRLGLEKVYVQAKRWKNNVGSPEIQGFMGALQLQGAAKGVFITTSSYTKDAREAAARARGSIVLVDGARLSELMIEHGVGVTHKPLKIPSIDNDYFEDA